MSAGCFVAVRPLQHKTHAGRLMLPCLPCGLVASAVQPRALTHLLASADVVQSGSPAVGRDALYALLALAFAARAWVEHKAQL